MVTFGCMFADYIIEFIVEKLKLRHKNLFWGYLGTTETKHWHFITIIKFMQWMCLQITANLQIQLMWSNISVHLDAMFLPIIHSPCRPGWVSAYSWGTLLLQLCSVWCWPGSLQWVFRFFVTAACCSARCRTEGNCLHRVCLQYSFCATFAPDCHNIVWCLHGTGHCDILIKKKKYSLCRFFNLSVRWTNSGGHLSS